MDSTPNVSVGLGDTVEDYWRARLRQHTQDSYAGLGMSKFPEDLRTYEHLLWLQRPDTVIEIGVQYGASALWFRDRLRTLRAYGHVDRCRVIGIELDVSAARTGLTRVDPDWATEIVLIEADVRDPSLPARVRELLGPDARCMVIEDSEHVYDTTRDALEGFSGFVPENGFFVVEDGCVDVEELRLDPAWPRGVLEALEDWLRTPPGEAFAVQRDLELYGVSCHPRGFLQRRTGGAGLDPRRD